MLGTRLPATLLVGLLLFVAFGCGPTLHKPTGKITKGGAPLKLSDKALPTVALYAESDKDFGTPEAVSVASDGTFKVNGRLGNGVATGKYRLSIVITDPYPNGKDMLDGKFAKGNGPVIDVKDASEIVIDVDKK